MRDGGFVAPFEQFRHGRAMRARGHEGSHRGLVGPDRARPESVARVAQNTESKAALGPPRLNADRNAATKNAGTYLHDLTRRRVIETNGMGSPELL